MVSHGQGDPGTQQQGGIDGGQPERRHGFKRLNDAGWGSGHAGHHTGPQRFEFRPQQSIFGIGQVGHRVHSQPPQCGKETAEKHHFRENKPTHAPPKGDVDAPAVLPAFAFTDGIFEPLKQNHEEPQQTKSQSVFAPGDAIHPITGTQEHKEKPDSAQGRMPGRRRHIIIGRLVVGSSTHSFFTFST